MSEPTFESLPVSLQAYIFSYNVSCTADIAQLRRVSRDFALVIVPLLPSTIPARGHFIKCMSEKVTEESAGSFVEDLMGTDYHQAESYGICVGDTLHIPPRDRNEIPIFPGCALLKLSLIGEPESLSGKTPWFRRGSSSSPSQVADRGNEMTLEDEATDLGDLCEKIESARSLAEVDALYEKAVRLKYLEPISNNEDEAESTDDEDKDYTYTYPVLLTLTVPTSAKCLVASEDSVVHLRASDTRASETSESPFYPSCLGAVYRAHARSSTSDNRSVHVLMKIHGHCDNVSEYLWSSSPDIDSLMFESVWNEHQTQNVKEGVAVVDGFIGKELKSRLKQQIGALAVMQQEEEGGRDYHPHSDGIVRDLVHPALYSYVEGVSKTRASIEDVPPCTVAAHDEQDTEGDENAVEAKDDEDFWGRQYESSVYQWLPTYFNVSSDGSCTVEDYINNLVPRDNPVKNDLHRSLAHLFQQALPYIETVYSYVRAVRPLLRSEEDETEYDTGDVPPLEMKYSPLRGQKLQVITKIVDYELKPGQTHTGVWHVEGMSHEEIVATALYILERDTDIYGGDILFKRAFHRNEGDFVFSMIAQSRPGNMEDLIHQGLTPLGKVETLSGRLIVFPNSHVHKVDSMTNTRPEKSPASDMDEPGKEVARRRIIVFFLVNPQRRIMSTREVAPQQVRGGGSMTHEEALKHRLDLMKERKYAKQDWNVREIELCEH